MHFNNQVLKVGTFDGILFSFFVAAAAAAAPFSVLCRRQPPPGMHPRQPDRLLGVVAQVVTNWGAAAAIKSYN